MKKFPVLGYSNYVKKIRKPTKRLPLKKCTKKFVKKTKVIGKKTKKLMRK